MSDSTHFDVIVIGSGPGGYVCAIRAAQLGLKTACIEKDATLGGTCLNVGCIPSKALLESSHRYHDSLSTMKEHGIVIDKVSLDLKTLQERRVNVVSQLTTGVDMLFKKNKITRFFGFGSLQKAEEGDLGHRVSVAGNDGSTQTVTADAVVLATGSDVAPLRGVDIDQDRIVDSTGALEFSEVPKELVVVGAGVIGLELGSVWSRLGSKVTVIEYADKILGATDHELSREAKKVLESQGLEFILEAGVESATLEGDKVTVQFKKKGADTSESLSADKVLVAIGRRPYTANLGLEEVGVKLDGRGRIEVSDEFQTTVPGIFAIGDVIKGPMLAHKAEDEGVAVAEILAGELGFVGYDAIPSIIYTHPEVASVGKTEEELKAAGIPYVKGRVRYGANGRAIALGESNGLVKILAHKETDRILGAHIIGAGAGDLIAELGLAIEFGASAEDVARTCHAHPTLSELVREAAMDCAKRAIHK